MEGRSTLRNFVEVNYVFLLNLFIASQEEEKRYLTQEFIAKEDL